MTRTANAEQQLRSFIAKFDAPNQALLRAARRALRKRLPTAHELVYDNYNFFVIGYSPTEKPSDAILSLTGSSNGVGLCFLHGAKLRDPNKILRGSGNQIRSIHLDSVAVLAQADVAALIDQAVEQARAPFASRGPRKLIIRSISAKQRPRRAAAAARKAGRASSAR
jgi:Domain of unknown function (DU1801)